MSLLLWSLLQCPPSDSSLLFLFLYIYATLYAKSLLCFSSYCLSYYLSLCFSPTVSPPMSLLLCTCISSYLLSSYVPPLSFPLYVFPSASSSLSLSSDVSPPIVSPTMFPSSVFPSVSLPSSLCHTLLFYSAEIELKYIDYETVNENWHLYLTYTLTQNPCFPPRRSAIGFGTGFSVFAAKGGKKARIRATFFRLQHFAFLCSFFLCAQALFFAFTLASTKAQKALVSTSDNRSIIMKKILFIMTSLRMC